MLKCNWGAWSPWEKIEQARELVRIRLEFFKPFAAVNEAQFSFKPTGE